MICSVQLIHRITVDNVVPEVLCKKYLGTLDAKGRMPGEIKLSRWRIINWRVVTSYSYQSTRKEVETRQKLYYTVLSQQKGYDQYSGMKEKSLQYIHE